MKPVAAVARVTDRRPPASYVLVDVRLALLDGEITEKAHRAMSNWILDRLPSGSARQISRQLTSVASKAIMRLAQAEGAPPREILAELWPPREALAGRAGPR